MVIHTFLKNTHRQIEKDRTDIDRWTDKQIER
jgi:hypothetical protein